MTMTDPVPTQSDYVRVRFASGDEIELDMSSDELIPLYDKALRKRKPLRVRASDGKLLAINPMQVVFFDDQQRPPF